MITAGIERRVGAALAVRLPPPWAWYLITCVLLIGAYYAPLPAALRSPIYTAISAVATLGLAAGALARRPKVWRAWALLAAGQAVYTVADAVYFFTADSDGKVPFPGLPDVFYLLVYPLLAAGLVILVRRRTPGWQAATVIDATIIGVSATMLWWVYLLHPLAAAPGDNVFQQSVSTAYLSLDLLVLVVALRLMLGKGPRGVAYYLILASLALMLGADVAYAVRTAAGTWQDGTWLDSLWLLSYVLLGAAGVHPSMRRLDERSAVATPDATPQRIVVLAVASLAGPLVLVVEHVGGRSGDVPIIAVACAIIFLLVLTRMAGLVAAQRYEAMTDGLTKLYTRRFFEENLRVETERAHRSGGQLGLLVIDVDHFKHINDTYGHPAGDRVLVELAGRLRALCRPGDIVARIGGEEFALLLPGAGAGRAMAVAERVRRFVAATPFPVGDAGARPITVSVGVAVLPGDGRTTADLVRVADQALYVAKRAGRDRVVTSPTIIASRGRPADREPVHEASAA